MVPESLRYLGLALFLVLAAQAGGQTPERQALRGIPASIDGRWLEVSQGRDESAQRIRVAIWGRLREPGFFEHGFRQLDGDPELEYIVVSRNEGSGPYYRLQIIDFLTDAIAAWSYASFGRPRIEGGVIELGRGNPQGAREPVYSGHAFTPAGLKSLP